MVGQIVSTGRRQLADRLFRRRSVHLVVLALVVLMATLPGLASLPPLDRDEPRYLQATKQMVESGDYVDIRFQDEHRYKKPAGIYWLQSLAVAATGEGARAPIWAYRLVSVAALLIAVFGLYWTGTALFGAEAGFAAALVLATIFGAAFEGRVGKTDAMLLAMTVLAQGALARIHAGARTGAPARLSHAVVFWLAQGVGAMIKGPIPLMASALTVVALSVMERDWRWTKRLRPLIGIAILVAVVLPWLVLIVHRTGFAFFHEAVGKDLMGKVASGQESHGAPPGYYVLTFSLFFWPFGAMAVGAGLAAISQWRESPALRFCLAWYIPLWLAFELIATKLPHYVLPAYPALALLLGWGATSDRLNFSALRNWQRWVWRLAAFGFGLVTLGLVVVALAASPYLTGGFDLVALPLAAAVLVAGSLGLSSGLVAGTGRLAGAAIAAAATYGLFFGGLAPSLGPLWPSRTIAEIVARDKPCATTRLAAASYHEPSLVFLVGTDTILTDVAGVASHLEGDPACALGVVPTGDLDRLDAALKPSGLAADRLATVDGWNLADGKHVHLAVLKARR
ncbi:ArnT family glycosyltransferase [Jiella sp. M17.18]|uniref:ArnT family glycosyltransferase n=1 Tax=Jiella sp. M17.18 TaxID=3234247 RepID=UPI0034DE2311